MRNQQFLASERIRIIPPADPTSADLDVFGEPAEPRGVEVWADRREIAVNEESVEGTLVRGSRTIFRIRRLPGLDVNSTIRDDDGVNYRLIGAPLLRGGAPQRMAAEFYELHCERRDARAVRQ